MKVRLPRTPEQAQAKARYDKERYAADPDKWRAQWRARYAALSPEKKAQKREQQARWRRDHPEQAREHQRRYRANAGRGKSQEWAARNPERRRDIEMRSTYGISWDTYQEMLDAQSGVCAICQHPETYRLPQADEVARLVVDHDHATNAVRGLLCRSCNLAIGHFQDDENRLLAAIDYLRRYHG